MHKGNPHVVAFLSHRQRPLLLQRVIRRQQAFRQRCAQRIGSRRQRIKTVGPVLLRCGHRHRLSIPCKRHRHARKPCLRACIDAAIRFVQPNRSRQRRRRIAACIGQQRLAHGQVHLRRTCHAVRRLGHVAVERSRIVARPRKLPSLRQLEAHRITAGFQSLKRIAAVRIRLHLRHGLPCGVQQPDRGRNARILLRAQAVIVRIGKDGPGNRPQFRQADDTRVHRGAALYRQRLRAFRLLRGKRPIFRRRFNFQQIVPRAHAVKTNRARLIRHGRGGFRQARAVLAQQRNLHVLHARFRRLARAVRRLVTEHKRRHLRLAHAAGIHGRLPPPQADGNVRFGLRAVNGIKPTVLARRKEHSFRQGYGQRIISAAQVFKRVASLRIRPDIILRAVLRHERDGHACQRRLVFVPAPVAVYILPNIAANRSRHDRAAQQAAPLLAAGKVERFACAFPLIQAGNEAFHSLRLAREDHSLRQAHGNAVFARRKAGKGKRAVLLRRHGGYRLSRGRA